MLRIAFLHPDLGLGGAERLVVDAAAGLARLVCTKAWSLCISLWCVEGVVGGPSPQADCCGHPACQLSLTASRHACFCRPPQWYSPCNAAS
jgi:hypothetical protein